MTLVERLSGAVVAALVVASLMSHVIAVDTETPDLVARAGNAAASEAIAVGYPEQVLWDYIAQQPDMVLPHG